MFTEPSVTWTKKHKQFAIQVHAFVKLDGFGWCLYVLVYDNHPYFDKPSELIDILEFHGGCTYDQKFAESPARGIRYDWQKEFSHLKIGCDYQHCQDLLYIEDPKYGVPFAIVQDAKNLEAQMSGLCKPDSE